METPELPMIYEICKREIKHRKLTRNLYLYTRYAPPPAIAKPIKITHTAAHADFPPLAALPAHYQGEHIEISTCIIYLGHIKLS